MRPLVIIESDLPRDTTLLATLEASGFRAERFTSMSAALPHLRVHAYALAILDLDLRGADPYAICREVSPHLPLIVVASSCVEDACVHALEHGADDCVQRRIPARELVARIRSVLRRSGAQQDDARHSLATSVSEMRVRANDTVHALSRGETEVLSTLLAHAPTPVTTARMAELLGARRGTVEARIKSLRRKLGASRLVSRGSLGYQLADD